ncbi:ATP-binding protein [Streptomyces sp. NPDC008343]|uniref:ATP-binding protein n=1 Tax=Streptomyces sp. NPDC008343 TaxID=3364828 RepID=UPI0036EF7FA2
MNIATTCPVDKGTHHARFGDHRHAVRVARRTLQERLTARGIGQAAAPALRERADAAVLVVSELVTNACRHASGPSEMRTSWDGPELTVEIDDAAAEMPRICPKSDRGEAGGFGMGLIDSLTDDWGTRPRTDQHEGKTVYARIRFPLGL